MGRISKAGSGTRIGAPISRALLLRGWSMVQDLFMPPICQHCRAKRWGQAPLCLACLKRLAPLRPPLCEGCGLPDCNLDHPQEEFPFNSVRFLFRMTPELSTLVHGFKYRHFRRQIPFLCLYLRYRPDLIEYLRTFDGLVPVPIHPIRRRERGYNQAEIIAKELSRISGVPILPQALRRKRYTESQTKLARRARGGNLASAFACSNPEVLMGKRLLIIDDVFTTGATAVQCANLLLGAGGQSVGVFALARVETKDEQDDFGQEMEAASGYVA